MFKHQLPFRNFLKISYGLLAIIFIGCLMYTGWVAYYLPVYGDEPQWKMIVARLFLDDGKLIYLFPACTKGFLMSVPITWYPARLFDAAIYADASDPFYLRRFGFITCIGLLLTWTVVSRYCIRNSLGQSFLLVSSFFMVGVLPLLMVYNRPEQSLLIWISVAIALGMVIANYRPHSKVIKIIVFTCFALLGCLLSATHPKGIYFLPLFIILFWRIYYSFWGVAGLSLIYIWTALETIALWKIRTKCPESGWLTTMLQGFSVQPALLKSNPDQFFETGTNNLYRWTQYLKGVTFEGGPYKYYVNPNTSYSWLDHFANNWVAVPIYAVAILIVVNAIQSLFRLYQNGQHKLVFIIAVYGAIVVRLWASESYTAWAVLAFFVGLILGIVWLLVRRNQSNWLIAFTLALCLMVLMFMQSLKNFYETTFVWPIFLLIGVFTFSATSTWARDTLKFALLPALLVMAIVATQARWDVMGNAPAGWKEDRQKIVLDNQIFKKFAKEACGIDSHTGLEENLVLDDETYPIFWRHTRPMLTAYVFGWWSQGADYKTTFMQYEPKGLATKCNSVPAELMPYVKQTKDFCCASKEDLNAFNQINMGKIAK